MMVVKQVEQMDLMPVEKKVEMWVVWRADLKDQWVPMLVDSKDKLMVLTWVVKKVDSMVV